MSENTDHKYEIDLQPREWRRHIPFTRASKPYKRGPIRKAMSMVVGALCVCFGIWMFRLIAGASPEAADRIPWVFGSAGVASIAFGLAILWEDISGNEW